MYKRQLESLILSSGEEIKQTPKFRRKIDPHTYGGQAAGAARGVGGDRRENKKRRRQDKKIKSNTSSSVTRANPSANSEQIRKHKQQYLEQQQKQQRRHNNSNRQQFEHFQDQLAESSAEVSSSSSFIDEGLYHEKHLSHDKVQHRHHDGEVQRRRPGQGDFTDADDSIAAASEEALSSEEFIAKAASILVQQLANSNESNGDDTLPGEDWQNLDDDIIKAIEEALEIDVPVDSKLLYRDSSPRFSRDQLSFHDSQIGGHRNQVGEKSFAETSKQKSGKRCRKFRQ